MDRSTGSSRPLRRRWLRRLRIFGIIAIVVCLSFLFLARHHLSTLRSLRRIEGTQVFVMDYYVDYNMDQIRRDGINVAEIEGSFIETLFPDLIVPFARRLQSWFVPEPVELVAEANHQCSTLAVRSTDGRTFFARNFDGPNDASLILRVHEGDEAVSVALIDLAYLNLNRADLAETSILQRIPLLFAPYYVMDGMNRHGVAVSAMTVPDAKASQRDGRPGLTQATLLRLILDYSQSVDDAIDLIDDYNIYFAESPEHLMIADSSGSIAVVEFIDGETRITVPDQQWQVCTNDILWQVPEEARDQRCSRYRSGSGFIAAAQSRTDLKTVLAATRTMAVKDWTMWTSLYDLNEMTVDVLYRSRPEAAFRDTTLEKTGLAKSGQDQ